MLEQFSMTTWKYDCRDAGGRATQDAVAEEVDNAGAIIEEQGNEAISNDSLRIMKLLRCRNDCDCE